MSAVRDPAFWKRFSVAVHMDEEESIASGGKRELQESNHWLQRTQDKKRHKYACLCWSFWIILSILIAAVIIVIVVLMHYGMFSKIKIGPSTS